MPSSVIEVGRNAQADALGKPLQLKVTVCVEPFCGVTVRATVPDWPATIVSAVGLADTAKSAAAVTVCETAGDVLVAKFESPPYCAVMECEPAASDAVMNVATPPAPTVPVPMEVAPSKNVTVPVMVPAVAEVTVAVNVTFAPLVDGLRDDATAVVVEAFATPFTT